MKITIFILMLLFLPKAFADCEDLLVVDQLGELKPRIEHMIQEAIEAGEVPVIFIDLDSTVFSHESRYQTLLKEFDRLAHKDFFAGVDFEKYPPRAYKTWAKERLRENISDPQRLDFYFDWLRSYVSSRKDHYEALLFDRPHENLVDALKEWQGQGAELVVVTARDNWQERGTRAALENAGLNIKRIYFFNDDFESTREYKAAAARHALHEGGYRPVAFFEDKREILDRLREEKWEGFLLVRALPALSTARFVEHK